MNTFEVPDEIVERIFQAIEKARVKGKIRKGTNETTKAAERGKALLVVLAKDIEPPELVMHLPIICEQKNIPYVFVPSKKELGAAAGLGVGCSGVAILDIGEAKKEFDDLVKKIAALKKAG